MNKSKIISTKSYGRVFQINRSIGGVPKKSINSCEVTFEGIVGDGQENKRIHGGPERALCLYSLELILKLEREGHPVFSGALGENLTFSGIDWGMMVPGSWIRIGNDVLLLVTTYTSPCQTIRKFFQEGRCDRIFQQTNPGWSRLYAKVTQPGLIQIGDTIQVLNK